MHWTASTVFTYATRLVMILMRWSRFIYVVDDYITLELCLVHTADADKQGCLDLSASAVWYRHYLEWLKYKNVKPLSSTVYRNRNWKQLGRKWSGKEISFEAVPINSQCWSWGGVGRQTVPEAASSHRKRTIASSGHWTDSSVRRITSCMWGWRPETAAATRCM